ncbi:hypothetical protein D3871_08170 [Noviherbaspirillum saxi]|uniref:Uncharacterized protein n=1 Tax=Noviherbaspirillum saxi TaxID=2320863 RepID=A0A3A3FQJ3_9BURK|nr:hypothetical protein D3871_08170 [Noviherbaspirillum saxi]
MVAEGSDSMKVTYRLCHAVRSERALFDFASTFIPWVSVVHGGCVTGARNVLSCSAQFAGPVHERKEGWCAGSLYIIWL